MRIYTEILGNIHSAEWSPRAAEAEVRYIDLDQWSAQKSRFVVMRPDGESCAVALERHSTISDGDIIDYDPERRRMTVLRVRLMDVMVADLASLADAPREELVRRAVELGHAIGNQHWPAVVKHLKVYVPLTVDRKVMESVMQTHNLEGVECRFERGGDVIPYLAPHEIRRLFGGAERHGHEHRHEHHAQ